MSVPRAQTAYNPAPVKQYNERAANAPLSTGYSVTEIPVAVNTPVQQKQTNKPAWNERQQQYADPYGPGPATFKVSQNQQATGAKTQTDWSNPSNYLDYLKDANPAAYKQFTSFVDQPRYYQMVADELKQQKAIQRMGLANAQAQSLIWGNKGILGF